MQFNVYILYGKSAGLYYIGHTNDIQRRLVQHNDIKAAGFTKRYQPWELISTEKFSTRAEAMQRERYLKSLKNKERLNEYIWGRNKIFSCPPK